MHHLPDLLNDDIKSLFLKYLAPSISATFVTSIYVLADTIMLGKGVGANAIAALNIILPIYSLLFGTGLLLGIGGGVLMSIANGSGNTEKANSYFTLSILCGIIFSIVYIAIGILFFTPLIFLLGGSKDNLELISKYFIFLVIFGPIFIFSSLLQAFVRNDRNPKRAMIAVITGGVTNIILDYIFIFQLNMSMAGGAAATVIGTFLTDCILLSHFFSPRNTMKLLKRKFHYSMVTQIFRCGLSSFFTEISSGALMLFFNLQLLRYIGEKGVIVYGIIANCVIVAMSLFNGIAQASQPLIATNFGAKQFNRVASIRQFGTIITAVTGILLFVSGFFNPEYLIGIFIQSTAEINSIGIFAIRIYFIAFLFMGVNIFYSTYFQSIIKPYYALLICFLRGFIISAILVFTLPLIIQPSSIWFVMPITELIVLMITILYLNNKSII